MQCLFKNCYNTELSLLRKKSINGNITQGSLAKFQFTSQLSLPVLSPPTLPPSGPSVPTPNSL